MFKRLYIVAVFITISFGIRSQIFNENIGFESGDFEPEWRRNDSGDPRSIIEVVSDLTRVGNYAIHFQHDSSYRAEIGNNDVNLIQHFKWGEEHWLGSSIYLEDWNTNPVAWHTLIQMHTVVGNWNWENCCSGDNGFTIHTTIDEDQQWLNIHANVLDSPMTQIPTCPAASGYAWRIPCPENNWLDFVFNFKLSTDNDGFIKVWYNGVLVVDISGPNVHYLDDCGVPREQYCDLAIGTYKKRTNTTLKSMYADEIRIGGPSSSYQDIAPSGGVLLNHNPVLESVGSRTLRERGSLVLSLIASDDEEDSLLYFIPENIDFITLNDKLDGTAFLTIDPPIGSTGRYELNIIVIDSKYGIDFETIYINVEKENKLPILHPIGDFRIHAGNNIDIPLSAYDEDDDSISYSLSSDDLAFVTLNDNNDGTGFLTISPLIQDIGAHKLIVIVSDDYNGYDSEIIKVNVDNAGQGNTAPILKSIKDQRIFEGEIIKLNLLSTDADGDLMSYEISDNLQFININDQNNGSCELIISPKIGDAGIYNPKVTVIDSRNKQDFKHFILVIDDISNPPFTIKINSGGNEITNGDLFFETDSYFDGGYTYLANEQIINTENDELYLSERFGDFSYNIPITENGMYTLRLHFAELQHFNGSVGSRIFDVHIENDQKNLINFDINAEEGPLKAIDRTFAGLEIRDKNISIDFESINGKAKISGIEVISEINLVTDLEKIDLEEIVKIHPNPSSGFFTVEISSNFNFYRGTPYIIYDISGKIIIESTIEATKNLIDFRNKKKGLYFFKMPDLEVVKIFIY